MSSNKDFLKGKEYYQQQDYEAAIESFGLAIAVEENPYIYYERALAYFHIKNNQAAMHDFNKAVELQPDNPFRYSSRAYVRDKMGDIEGAIADYQKAIELDPEDAVAFNNLGLLEEKLGWKEKSKQKFAKADALSGYLPEVKSETLETKPSEQKENDPQQNEKSMFSVIKNVFTKSQTRTEFITFVKNGFKF